MVEYEINPAVAYREVEGQVLFLLPDEYDVFTLNATGKWVWEELVVGQAPAAIATALAERYQVPLAQAQGDVDALVRELLARGVLLAR